MATGRAAEPARGLRAERSSHRALPSWAPIAALYLLAVAVYAVLALRTQLPVLFPDEFRYFHLERSLADGEGFDWSGQPIDQTARLYIYAIAPLWAIFESTVDAWRASKVFVTLALCTQVVPVWWLAREL